MSITELKPGDLAEVEEVYGDGELRQRLLDLGILPGRVIEFVRFAPLGDPLEIEVLGSRISLRATEANLINVRKLPEQSHQHRHQRTRTRGMF